MAFHVTWMQVWNMVAELPYQDRFRLYGAWRGHAMERQGLSTKHPQLVVAEVLNPIV